MTLLWALLTSFQMKVVVVGVSHHLWFMFHWNEVDSDSERIAGVLVCHQLQPNISYIYIRERERGEGKG